MAYSGYRIQINGNAFANTDMARGSFSISKNPRICESYTDTEGITHERFYSTTKTIISFAVREHNLSEHSDLASPFATRANVSVSYYDTESNNYVSGTFKIKDFTWNENFADANNIEFGETTITLEEY